jgi:hypothetical protein
MKKFTLIAALLIGTAPAFAGTKYNPEVSGVRDCEMVKVMSERNPGQVLYTYRADPTCGNVRVGKDVLTASVLVKDKAGNVIGTRWERTVISDENNGG